MSIRSQIRNFTRAFRRNKPSRGNRHQGHALARTIKHGTTVAGGNANLSLGNVGTERRNNLMAESAERYDSSFGKGDE